MQNTSQAGTTLGAVRAIRGAKYTMLFVPARTTLSTDYYANGTQGCTPQLCPYGLSDFFKFSQAPNPFIDVPPTTYQPSDFVNLSGFGGVSLPPDSETE